MIEMQIEIQNLDKLRENFRRAPSLTLKYLSKAVAASIFEVEKQAVDSNFQFKTPRALRTGQLANSFAFGRRFSADGLSGSIGPTVRYAPYVYFGTTRGLKPNKYMDRIAKAAEPEVQKHFNVAITKIADSLAS
jgi:hypothetical protein